MANRSETLLNLRNQIITAAKNYAGLTKKTYLYVYGQEYFELLFAVGSFMHLTGVSTVLRAEDCYHKAITGTLSGQQLDFTKQQTMRKVKKKLPCLEQLPQLTKTTVCVVKDLSTNTLLYKLGLTNLEFTLGVSQPSFANKFPAGVYIPRSLRVKDKAIENSSAGDFVDFVLERNLDQRDAKYSRFTYRDLNKKFPVELYDLLEEKLRLELE